MNADAFEQERTGKLPIRTVLAGLWPFFRGKLPHLGGAFALLTMAALLTIAGPILVKRAIDVDIAGRDARGLRLTVLLYLGAQLLHVGVVYTMRNWLEWAGQGMMAALKRRLFDHLLALPLRFHDREPAGRLLSRVENDSEALRLLFTTTSVMLAADALLFVGMFIAMGVASPRLTLVVAIILPFLIGSTFVFRRRTHPIFLRVRGLTAEICARLAEFVQGVSVLQAFERRRWAAGSFQRLNREKFGVEFRGERYVILWFNFIFLLQTVAFVLILGVGGTWALGGLVTIGTLAMFMGYIRRFFEPLFRLSEQLATIQKGLAAAERIFLLFREPVAIADPAAPRGWPGLRRHVRFDDVWMRYSGDGDWVLRGVSFTLPAGERWAIVGPTGSGKTSIVSLLLRLYEVQRGRILIDDVDIRDMSQSELRRHIGLVLQDIYLFPGSLEENLRLGGDAGRDRVEEAARLTMAHRFIERLPATYATNLFERGANLSVGERQLLSFTRAILRDPSLLILDEATSSVDPATEETLARSVHRVLEGRTALIIAHRLSTIRECDNILVLHRGQVVEAGRHDALIARSGLYRTLHELQFREVIRAG
jgi:ABC-type multidrug transport system fused ATPase/permease subunit